MAEVERILCPNCHKPNLRRAKFCQECRHDMVLNNDGPQYFITRVIKEGGQGAVFETIGEDGQVYAVKEMLDRFTDPKERAESIKRFEAEADMLRRLTHERIPKVYVDFKDEGRQYLAMEFVRGQDLEEVIKRQGALPEQQVLAWADQLCDVLDYLHNHKPEPIIFRDMKPSNIMIQPDGGIKLIDFGIAKLFQKAERGTQIGTPGYAPPEQYQGLATIESDIYALGATLHHALTGRDPRDEPPFSFPPVYALRPSVSKRTSEAIQRALQMKPEDRYHSVAEFRAALRPTPPQPPRVRVAPATQALPPQPQVAATPAIPAPMPSTASAPTQRAQPIAQAQPAPRRRSRVGLWLFMLLLILVLGGAGVAFAFPDVVNQVVPGLLSAPTSPPRTLISVRFTAENMEVIVPAGADTQALRQAFTQAFITAAQPQYPGAEINPNAPPSFVGTPEKVDAEANGQQKYRATMEGFILKPQ